ERGQPVDGVPQAAFHLLGLGRKELKGNGREFWRALAVRRGSRHLGHGGIHSAAAVRTSGLPAVRQNKPNASVQTAHLKWEIAQYLQINPNNSRGFDKVGRWRGQRCNWRLGRKLGFFARVILENTK